MGRYDRLRRIEELDPKGDHAEIYHLICGYEFPWDMTRALEVALYRTYCVPSISALLDRTGEFYKRTQKRYDDTALIVAEISKWGYNSERGREALRRMNRAHSRFDISNGDYLYVLSTFIYEPIRWIERFGWRRMSKNEKKGGGGVCWHSRGWGFWMDGVWFSALCLWVGARQHAAGSSESFPRARHRTSSLTEKTEATRLAMRSRSSVRRTWISTLSNQSFTPCTALGC